MIAQSLHTDTNQSHI